MLNINKLNLSQNTPISPFQWSLLIHSLFVILFLIFIFLSNTNSSKIIDTVKIEFQEVVNPVQTSKDSLPVIKTQNNTKVTPQKTKSQTPPRKIFGINKNTITSDTADGMAIKSGNTISKDIDQETLKPEDELSLPEPVEEFLITSMPKIKIAPQIPYPPEAKSKNIEGLVLLEILIDENGKVRSAVVIDSPGFGLDEAALKAIYLFEFAPALIDNKPVPVKIKYGYRFLLN